MPPMLVPLAYFGFNLVYTVLAIPLGSLSDRIGRRRVIAALLFWITADRRPNRNPGSGQPV